MVATIDDGRLDGANGKCSERARTHARTLSFTPPSSSNLGPEFQCCPSDGGRDNFALPCSYDSDKIWGRALSADSQRRHRTEWRVTCT